MFYLVWLADNALLCMFALHVDLFGKAVMDSVGKNGFMMKHQFVSWMMRGMSWTSEERENFAGLGRYRTHCVSIAYALW